MSDGSVLYEAELLCPGGEEGGKRELGSLLTERAAKKRRQEKDSMCVLRRVGVAGGLRVTAEGEISRDRHRGS